MTARQLFESALIELNKVNAPSLLLSEFNYYINKAINNYINLRYNIYDMSQLTTDDIRVLKSTAILTPKPAYRDGNGDGLYKPSQEILGEGVAESRLSSRYPGLASVQAATYEVLLPMDYVHLLNCICTFRVKLNWKCYDGGSYVTFAAKKLTSDSWSTIINDYYNRPRPERPYYFIHTINTSETIPTNPVLYENSEYLGGTDMAGIYGVTTNAQKNLPGSDVATGEDDYDLVANEGSNFPRVVSVAGSNTKVSTVEKPTAYRFGNASPVRLEVRYGKDTSVFELVEVAVDYIKAPQYIRLTQELMDLTMDTSQIMEFPDYVCQEIINELAKLLMVRSGDPTAQNFIAVSLTIANPAQAQQLTPQS